MNKNVQPSVPQNRAGQGGDKTEFYNQEKQWAEDLRRCLITWLCNDPERAKRFFKKSKMETTSKTKLLEDARDEWRRRRSMGK